MIEEIKDTSMLITANVKIRVPKGSPRTAARHSAWRTTPNAHHSMVPNSQQNSTIDHRSGKRSDSRTSGNP